MFDKKEKNMIIPPCHVELVETSAVRWMYHKQISRLATLARDDKGGKAPLEMTWKGVTRDDKGGKALLEMTRRRKLSKIYVIKFQNSF